MQKAYNLLTRCSQMKKRSRDSGMQVIRPNDKEEFNKFFEAQSNNTACGKSCIYSKAKVFEKQKCRELKKELRKHGIHTKSGQRGVLRSLLKTHYAEHGLDTEGLASWF